MISYEVAKELKDAGFPQSAKKSRVRIEPLEEFVYIPTLSELIEACGDDINYIERGEDNEGETYWHAERSVPFAGGEGPTPEESVACLWLALQKKSN
jgi:hypothetical protein